MTEEPDDFEYTTRVDVNIAIIREIVKLRFKQRLPKLMEAVTKELIAAGVDFSKARIPENLDLTEADWDAIYEDLR